MLRDPGSTHVNHYLRSKALTTTGLKSVPKLCMPCKNCISCSGS